MFLSYAREDADAARRLADALRASGVEVWFDQSELHGGDAWDAKIRQQIKECALFVPIVSANTQARAEGYFRLEWKLADRRSDLIGKSKAFLLPVCIDDTRDSSADVPDSFLAVQWMRLRDGAGSADFCARVQHLLDGRSDSEAQAPALARAQTNAGDPAAANSPPPADRMRRRKTARRLAAAAIGAVLLTALAFWRPWSPREPAASPALRNAPPGGQQIALPEAKRLLRQAEEILRKAELGMSEIDTATRLCDRATALDPGDAQAWALASEVDSWGLHYSGDKSAERREGARAKAARAMNLAPALFESRRAQACFLTYVVSGGAAQAEQLCRALWQERPGDYQTALVLAMSLRNQGRSDEAHAFYDEQAQDPRRAAKMLNEKAWSLYNTKGRVAEADAALDKSIAAEPYTGNVSLKVLIALHWHGDADLALAAWNKLPVSVRLEDRALSAAILLFGWRREPGQLLALLRNVPREWVSWKFNGPIAAVTGDAHEMANRPAAARNDWRTALGVVERRLTHDRANAGLMYWRAYLQAALGDAAAAAESLKLARELPGGFDDRWLDTSSRLRTPEELLNNLERKSNVWAGALRLNPAYDAVRQTPRFQALLARADADPLRSPKAARQPSARK